MQAFTLGKLLRRVLPVVWTVLIAVPGLAAIDLGNLGVPGLGDGPIKLDPNLPPDLEPDLPPPPPDPLIIGSVGNDFLRVVANPGRGTHKLFRQKAGGSFDFLRSVPAETRTEILQENLAVGTAYCYRLDSTLGGQTIQRVRCATTDWRVGFTGPITRETTERVLRLFDWRDTRPLAVGEELPSLFYMNVLVDDTSMPEGLRDVGIHMDAAPIFSDELDGWTASSTLVHEGEKVTGRWYYAMVPGHFYNQIRERVLNRLSKGEEPGIRAMVFRKLPAYDAREFPRDAHQASYRYLGERGFEFNGEINNGCVYSPDLDADICPQLLGWLIHKIGGWIWEGAESLVEGIRYGIGQFQLIYKDDVHIDVAFRIQNTDSKFGTDRYMVSGWSGEELRLRGMRVHVRQGLAAFYGKTTDQARFTKRVLRGVSTKICIETENDVVELTEFLTEETVCMPSLGKLTSDLTGDFPVRHDYLNTVAAMTDAHDYLLRVAGYDMPKITVLVGGTADKVALLGRSFAPCMGRYPSVLGLVGDLAGPLIPLGSLAAIGTEFATAVDIVLRTDSDGARGVAVHEYGHAVMCDLLLSQGFATFQTAWTDVIIATSDQSPGNDTSYINEAFADYLTSQVVGGTNYFAPHDEFVSSGSVNYCKSGSDCVEYDFDSAASFHDQVARITSLLHDAFDGNDARDGSYWTPSGALLSYKSELDSDQRDERISLARTDLKRLFDYWDARGNTLTEGNFLGGLADLLQARGYDASEICELFAAHDPSGVCPEHTLDQPWLAWYSAPGAAAGGLFGTPTGSSGQGSLAIPAAWLASAVGEPTHPGQTVIVVDHEGELVPLDQLTLASLPEAFGTSNEPAPPAYPLAVVAGIQKLKLAGFGKDKRDSAFAFRIGEGWWEGIDPLGQQLGGGWSQRGKKGTALRLNLAPEFESQLARLLAESLDDQVAASAIAITSPPKLQLKIRPNDTVAGKVTVAFEATVDGELRRGQLVAKLKGQAQ